PTRSTPLPYTTLFRSVDARRLQGGPQVGQQGVGAHASTLSTEVKRDVARPLGPPATATTGAAPRPGVGRRERAPSPPGPRATPEIGRAQSELQSPYDL